MHTQLIEELLVQLHEMVMGGFASEVPDLGALDLNGLAQIANENLAWDAKSFLISLGVEGADEVSIRPTDEEIDMFLIHEKLTDLNNGISFTYDLTTWAS